MSKTETGAQVSRRLTFVPASLVMQQSSSPRFVPEAQLVVAPGQLIQIPRYLGKRKMTSLKWQEDNS